MIFQFPLSAMSESHDDESFMRGVAATKDYFCVGASTGSVVVFNCDHFVEGHDFPLIHTLTTDQNPIATLATGGQILAAGNDTGRLFLYKTDEAFVEACTFPGCGYPCTAMAMHDHMLITAFSSGHIRCYRTDIYELTIEITAHTRIITGLAINANASMFVSCGQDQYVHVWSFPDLKSRGGTAIIKLFSEVLEDRMCTGVAFLSGDRIAVSSYDEDDLVVFKK